MSDDQRIIDTIAEALRAPYRPGPVGTALLNETREEAESVLAALRAARIAVVELPESETIPGGEGYVGCTGLWSPLDGASLATWSDGKPAISAEFYVGDLTKSDARALAAALLAAADAAEAAQ